MVEDTRDMAPESVSARMKLRDRLYGPATRVLPPAFFEKRQVRQAREDIQRAGVVFIHTPRTAGLSVLRAVYGCDTLRHFTIDQFLRVAKCELMHLPRFAVVRNPWDRAVSAYRIARQGGIPNGAQMLHPEDYRRQEFRTFGTFVRDFLGTRDVWKLDGVFRPQTYYVGRKTQTKLNHLGYFERLYETEAWLSSELGRPIELVHSNKTEREPYQNYYTEATRKIVGRAYREDIAEFGFTF
jgi:chondroitin 4-sulfotransferase 11